MRWDVALLPGLIGSTSGKTCIVVDVLRASTTLVTLFERGINRVAVAADTVMARGWQQRLPDWVLVGEENTLKPPGFDFGNSPSEISRAELVGRNAIMTTSNGTGALRACRGASSILVGSLVNRRSVVERARSLGNDVVVVCAGTGRGEAIALEDVFAAGVLIESAEETGGVLSDGAQIALRVATGFSDPRTAFVTSHHGQRLIALGLLDDLNYCTQIDRSVVVPSLIRRTPRPLLGWQPVIHSISG